MGEVCVGWTYFGMDFHILRWSNAFVVEKEKLELTLVPPFSFGLGLPYAHEGWSNASDV